MTLDDIQTRLNALSAAMVTKGLKKPRSQYSFEANAEGNVYLCWEKDHPPRDYDRQEFKFCRGAPAKAFAEAEAYVASLPNADERRRNEFMSALGGVIDLGRENGIEVEYLNPLMATAKALSENALTYRTQAEAR